MEYLQSENWQCTKIVVQILVAIIDFEWLEIQVFRNDGTRQNVSWMDGKNWSLFKGWQQGVEVSTKYGSRIKFLKFKRGTNKLKNDEIEQSFSEVGRT